MKELFQPSNVHTGVFCKGLQRYLWQENWHSCTEQGARIWRSNAVCLHSLHDTHWGLIVQQSNRGRWGSVRIDWGKRGSKVRASTAAWIICSMTEVHTDMESYSSHTQCICPLSSPSTRAGCCIEHLALIAGFCLSVTKRNLYYAQQDPLKCKWKAHLIKDFVSLLTLLICTAGS